MQDFRMNGVVGRHDHELGAAVLIHELTYETHVVRVALAIQLIHALGAHQRSKPGPDAQPAPTRAALEEIRRRIEGAELVAPEQTSPRGIVEVANALQAVSHDRTAF